MSVGLSAVEGPVLIIGAGLLGSSIGLGLRAQSVDVVVSDASPTNEAVAEDIGAGRSLRALEQSQESLPDPAVVVVASPPDVTASIVIESLRKYPHATVMDISSVKRSIVEDVLAANVDASRYVGTHPMAGREKSGPVAARGELFTSMPWVICAHESTRPEAVKTAVTIAVELGATVTHLDVEEHDRTVALISHVPQVMSSLLASRLQDTPLYALRLAGQGLRDTVRIAGSDPGLWVQILSANAQPVVQTLYGVRDLLINMQRDAIKNSGYRMVAEGRDITTVVAPDADARILLTASEEVRLARRGLQLGGTQNNEQLAQQVSARDAKDSKVNNFTEAAEGVTLVDSSDLNFEETIDAVIKAVEEARQK